MTKKQIAIFVLFNVILLIIDFVFIRSYIHSEDDQEGVRTSIVQTPDEVYIEVRATRLK